MSEQRPLEHWSCAYLYVAYPFWVRWLRSAVSALSKFVFRIEFRTARFFRPDTGEEVKR